MGLQVLIYQDYVHNNGILHRNLSSYYGRDRVDYCDARDILNGRLGQDVYLLVMPGGADLYYCEKLNGDGNRLIYDYIENGGNYLGLCAGAYYGCRAINWGKETDQEITGPRELNFIDCVAEGPVWDFIKDKDIDKSWKSAAIIDFIDNDDPALKVYYNGGPVFKKLKDPDAKVLAVYKELENKPAAIIEKKIGHGRVILCSPHMEYTPQDIEQTLYRHFNPFYEDELLLINQLEPYETYRNRSFNGLLSRFKRS